MITSTTEKLEGYIITEYLGVVTARREYDEYSEDIIDTLTEKAEDLEADAIIGISFIPDNGLFLASGTAVKVMDKHHPERM